jgi:hypothetical protein
MRKIFNSTTFLIDMIVDYKKLTDPAEIVKYATEVLEEPLTISQVKDYFNYTEDYEKESWTIQLSDIF